VSAQAGDPHPASRRHVLSWEGLMWTYFKIWLAACLVAIVPASRAFAQSDAYKTPLYWSTYEFNIVRQHIGVCYNYVPESVLLNNINWVDANLKKFGYNTIEIDGWGDSQELNENGYRITHSRLWQHNFAYWSAYLQSRGDATGYVRRPSMDSCRPVRHPNESRRYEHPRQQPDRKPPGSKSTVGDQHRPFPDCSHN
jgi:hypothetical protein